MYLLEAQKFGSSALQMILVLFKTFLQALLVIYNNPLAKSAGPSRHIYVYVCIVT
jgi:hypothetical protein